ncbi:unnamed protein product [Leptidea sinapis]|nr:unnamed protein product [Leptidea sinapis]
MLVMNGKRRRTPGGVYFFLLKRDDDVSMEMVNKIFSEDRRENARRIKRSRQKVVEQLKQSLTDSELPSLLSRGEATVQSEHGSNPPPSPATDAREGSSDTDAHSRPASPLPDADTPLEEEPSSHTTTSVPSQDTSRPFHDTRQLQEYDDDCLEVMCNDDIMDLF